MKRMTNWRLWQPPSETIDAIASVLSSHWTAAKTLHPQGLWARPATWLRRQATRFVDQTAPLVEESEAAESKITI